MLTLSVTEGYGDPICTRVCIRPVARPCADCQSELVVLTVVATLSSNGNTLLKEERGFGGLRLRLSAVVPGSWERSGADTPLG